MKTKILAFLLEFLKNFRDVILVMITILFPLIAFGYFIAAIFSSANILIGLLKMFVVAPIIPVFGIMACKYASSLGIWDKIYHFVIN